MMTTMGNIYNSPNRRILLALTVVFLVGTTLLAGSLAGIVIGVILYLAACTLVTRYGRQPSAS